MTQCFERRKKMIKENIFENKKGIEFYFTKSKILLK